MSKCDQFENTFSLSLAHFPLWKRMVVAYRKSITHINHITQITHICRPAVRCLLVTLFAALTINVAAQKRPSPDTLSPMQIVQRYVSPDGFPNKLRYFCCELYREWYADSTLGQQLPGRVQRECKLLYQDTLHAAIAVWLHDSTVSRDYYFYLMHGQNWQLYAIRSLVMTDAAHREMQRLDSIPEKERGDAYTKKNKHTFTFDYENLKLWSGSDTMLTDYFHTHEKQFLQMQQLLSKKGFYGKSDTLLKNSLSDKKVAAAAEKLLIREIAYDPKLPGTVFYVIGGISDNTVGYFYQPDPKKVPPMTEKKYILVRPVAKNWYLFKTT